MQTLIRQSPAVAGFAAFIERVAVALYQDSRVRILWLTGSLAAGTGDAASDVDFRAGVQPEQFANIGEWWPQLVDSIAPNVWKQQGPGPSDEVLANVITLDFIRFDLILQSVTDTTPRSFNAAHVLFDKDGIAERIQLTAPTQHNPLATLPYVVEEFIRLLGMITIVAERDDVPIGMEGQLVCHSLLISLLLMENGIDRMTMSKRRVASLLNEEQRTVLANVPVLAPTLASLVRGRMDYARIFLPRARRLMESSDLEYPSDFEAATLCHLKDKLSLDF